jgi:hypothetical protein
MNATSPILFQDAIKEDTSILSVQKGEHMSLEGL